MQLNSLATCLHWLTNRNKPVQYTQEPVKVRMPMKGYEQMLCHYLGSGAHFTIPVYQRDYDWKIQQCRQLYDDLLAVSSNKLPSHFFGSIVAVGDPGGQMLDYLIVDGQQRLTTVSLLALAMHNMLKQGVVHAEQQNLADLLLNRYLIDEYAPTDQKMKLKLNPIDAKAYEALFDVGGAPDETSNVVINYNYFCNRIQNGSISMDDLHGAMCKLQIINISLNPRDDNPQLIFESLNSTGLALTEGDKIRNYILMDLKPSQQRKYYKKYWKEIANDTSSADDTVQDVSGFVRDYLSVKQRAIPTIKNVYQSFKDYCQRTPGLTTDALLDDMLAYARRYKRLIDPDMTSKDATELEECIYRLNRLKTTITRPFFLEVLRLQEEGALSSADVLSIFRITESFLFRRLICEFPTNALNKIFLFLHRDIVQLDGTTDDYCDKLIYVLNSKRDSGRFPSDEEFLTALMQRNIYQMTSGPKKYILERLENGGLKGGSIGIWNSLDNGVLTIEHIMPQALNRGWKRDLGEDYERIHNEWLHRLPNLTLTAYNSEYRNSRFKDKKTMDGGFAVGGLHINSWIKEQSKWTEEELKARSALLAAEALDLWPKPTTSYAPRQRQAEQVALSDDEELTGKNISSYIFHGIEHNVSTWADMYQQVLQELHEEDKSILTKMAMECSSGKTGRHFRSSPNPPATREIDRNVHVVTGISTQTKLNVLRKILPLFDEDPAQLVFRLREKKEHKVPHAAQVPEDPSAKYWDYALPVICDSGKMFERGHKVAGNVLIAPLSTPGVRLECSANSDSAEVRIIIDTGNKQKDEELFDLLESHAFEIASIYQGLPKWDRSGAHGSPCISDKRESIGLDKRGSWSDMAQFHGMCAARMTRAIEKYL